MYTVHILKEKLLGDLWASPLQPRQPRLHVPDSEPPLLIPGSVFCLSDDKDAPEPTAGGTKRRLKRLLEPLGVFGASKRGFFRVSLKVFKYGKHHIPLPPKAIRASGR